jgi:proteasome lid subunit RPN8/RPN11
MAIELTLEHRKQIEQHAAEAYPNECCGFLLGREEGDGRRVVLEVAPMPNAWQSSEHNPYEKRPEDSLANRSMVDPKDFLRVDREAREKGLEILSFYHSHPDHPARPSEFDRQHALPFFVYVILAVERGIPREMTAWLLNRDFTQLLSEEISIK